MSSGGTEQLVIVSNYLEPMDPSGDDAWITVSASSRGGVALAPAAVAPQNVYTFDATQPSAFITALRITGTRSHFGSRSVAVPNPQPNSTSVFNVDVGANGQISTSLG